MKEPQESKAVIFMHIPKACGSTLKDILNRQYSRQSTYETDGRNITASIAEFQQLPEGDRSDIRCLKGHMPFGLHEYLPQPSQYITIMRDPVERVMSHYYYALRCPEHYLYERVVGEGMGLEDYVASKVSSELENGQTRMLSGSVSGCTDGDDSCTEEDLAQAKANLEKHVIAGLAESFNESLALFAAELGWTQLDYASKNISQQRPRKKDLSRSTLDVIEAANRLDLELYEAARDIFSKRTART